MDAKLRQIPTIIAVGLASLSMAGCAGDLGAARDAAKNGAVFVSDMQKATSGAISDQRNEQQAALAQAVDLSTSAQLDTASTSRHVATWQSDKSEDAQALFKAVLSLTSDSDLTKTAPFIVMAPLPTFNTPAIDDKSFTEVIAAFNKLSKGLSPMDRAQALIPFIKAAAKAYKDAAAGVSDKAAKPDTATGVAATLQQAASLNAKSGSMTVAAEPAASPALTADNATLVDRLTNAMSLQP